MLLHCEINMTVSEYLGMQIIKSRYSFYTCDPVDRALDSKIIRSGVQFPVLAMCRSVGQTSIPHCLSPPSCNGYLVHRSKVGSIVAGCNGAHLTRGKVRSVEHALSWSLDS